MKKILNKVFDLTALAYVGAAFYYQHNVSHPNTRPYEELREYGIENGYYERDFIENLEKELVILTSEHGYDIYGYYIDNNSDKNIILSHGITSNIYGVLKYAKMYLDLGFNIFVYDHRNHGRSGGSNTSFGYYEKDDLETCMTYMRERVGKDKIIGVHGESMGTAIALQHQAKYDSADFVVADCGFSSMNQILSEVTRRENRVPVWYARPLASLVNKIFIGEFFSNISPIECVKEIEKPIFFVHGDSDDYVYPSHSREMFAAKTKGYRKIYFTKGALHAVGIVDDRENYIKEMKEFLSDINVK